MNSVAEFEQYADIYFFYSTYINSITVELGK